MVPNVGINFKWNQRRGRTIVPPPTPKNTTSHATTLRRNLIRSRAAFMFNSLPAAIRNISQQTSMDTIKNKIDNYLKYVVDEPVIGGYIRSNNAASNSIAHQPAAGYDVSGQ